MKLSILICTLPSRQASYGRLITSLWGQILPHAPGVGIISNGSTELSIGAKRNWLLDKAESDYICFIDDDDTISPNYIELLMKGIEKGVDCASLKGEYSVNGEFKGIFEHSRKYNFWRTNGATTPEDIKYERYPNHLNMIRTSIAKKFKFPETNHGEDHDWSTRLHKSGLLKKEHYIPEIIYYYKKITNVFAAR